MSTWLLVIHCNILDDCNHLLQLIKLKLLQAISAVFTAADLVRRGS
jgi:hypothetical protein